MILVSMNLKCIKIHLLFEQAGGTRRDEETEWSGDHSVLITGRPDLLLQKNYYYSLLLIKFALLFKVIKVSWYCSLVVECFPDIYKALDLIPALEESPEQSYQGLSASTVEAMTLGSTKLKGNSPHFLR